MAKQQYIQNIKSYLGDGSLDFPVGVRADLVYNDVTLDELKSWIDIIKSSLSSISNAQKLILVPEGLLATIVSNVEQIRAYLPQLVTPAGNINDVFAATVNHAEQLIGNLAPYLNLVDTLSYKNLSSKVEQTLNATSQELDNNKKAFTKLTTNTKSLQNKSENILKNVSSGVLSENFGKLSNSLWNWSLMVLSGILSIVAFVCLLTKSSALTSYLITALEAGNVDYRIFFAKWATTIPYLFLLSIGLLELRSRIKLRDLYIFRKSVAGSLDGYTETLLNKVEDIKDLKERSTTRRMVVEFMINSMLELTKSPNIRLEKQKATLKVKDVVEAGLSSG